MLSLKRARTLILVNERRAVMKKYKKPTLKAEKKNDFVFNVIKAHVKGPVTCNQCSSCHSCRG